MNATRVIRSSALYDLVVTLPLATPWTARWLIESLGHLHDTFGLSGQRPVVDGAITVMFANLMGSLVVVWTITRLRSPTLAHGRSDTIARFLFALWMGWALVAGGSTVLVAFLVAEVGWAIVQGHAVRTAGKLAV